jgi:hypothetical protein
MSNLIATDQIRGGDWIRIEFDTSQNCLSFFKEAEGLPAHAMADLLDHSMSMPALAFSSGALFEPAKTQTAKSSKRG